jgi:hypothetical protein
MKFYGYCMIICEDFASSFDGKGTGCCVMTTQRLTPPFSPGNFWAKTAWLSSPTHSTCPTWPPTTFLLPPVLTQGRFAGSGEHLHRTRLSGCNLRMAETLENVFTFRRGLPRGWWWPIGPNGFDPGGGTSPVHLDAVTLHYCYCLVYSVHIVVQCNIIRVTAHIM